MKSTPNRKLVPCAAILVMTVGSGWLLTALKVIPRVDWVWIAGLAVVGVLIPTVAGLDKVTVIAGPFLLIAAACSLMRQLAWIAAETEAPLLVIVAGALLFAANLRCIPRPGWLIEPQPETE